ncbi:MAG: 7-carboxy-7-deazaguanine synthase QueE [bacterium]
MFKIDEIFYSIQGEGYHAGTPCHFVRFTTCNRSCAFCDTKRPPERAMDMTIKDIIRTLSIQKYECKRVVLTGGEPFHQEDVLELIRRLAYVDYKVHVETNGDKLPDPISFMPGDAWITVSPKEPRRLWPRYISEIKWLVGDGRELWQDAIRLGMRTPQFLQPVQGNVFETERNTKTAISLVKEYPNLFRLSAQLHKIWGVR